MFRIKKLDIFIARQFGLLFVGTFFICQFVLMMQFLWLYVDKLIGKGLSLDVLAQFFWYMGLILIPQALPLAILLSSLITFGNLGESSELTAIKAAGISLMQAFRSLILIVILITLTSFYFQNVVGPAANASFQQLLLSMKQKSPELEIPEGKFYDGIPGSNIYVQKKDLTTGMLYGIMIYRQSGSYEDQAIILADSGMMQSTAEKKHLLLTLYSGEWFENMRSQDLAGSASVPYRRETFGDKKILLDFDGEFNLADAGSVSANAKGKGLKQILHDLDSIRAFNDSVGHAFYREAKMYGGMTNLLSKKDSAKVLRQAANKELQFDSIYSRLTGEEKQRATTAAINSLKSQALDIETKADYTKMLNRRERTHQMEAINKFTLSLSCLIFFFIGAPLGAIIRKGGLGVPVIISVLVFIIYYIFDNSGMRMAREDEWTVWFGKLLGTAVLTPVAVFFTYKANNDSVVFNIELYRDLLRRIFGLRVKRYVYKKEVIIEDPDYAADAVELDTVSSDILKYNDKHHLLRWPNPINVFFHEGDDQEVERINNSLEKTIEDLSNSSDKQVLALLNAYPVIATHAHTRPFRQKWLNAIIGLLLPVGLFFYFRMIRFRVRLYKDLRHIRQTNNQMTQRIAELTT